MEKSCDRIKRSGKTLEQCKKECKNLRIYFYKEILWLWLLEQLIPERNSSQEHRNGIK